MLECLLAERLSAVASCEAQIQDHISDRIANEIDMKAYDLAGNFAHGSLQVKVDTVRPTSQFSSPITGSTNTLVRGSFSLSGSSADSTSGVSAAEISVDGKTWLPLAISPSNT